MCHDGHDAAEKMTARRLEVEPRGFEEKVVVRMVGYWEWGVGKTWVGVRREERSYAAVEVQP